MSKARSMFVQDDSAARQDIRPATVRTIIGLNSVKLLPEQTNPFPGE